MNISIPDELGATLNQRFGGELHAPAPHNPLGYSADSSFRIKECGKVSNADIVAVIMEYYGELGWSVTPLTNFCFEVTKDGVKLWVSISNYTDSTSRIVGNVSEMH